jgi:hypothetical protein
VQSRGRGTGLTAGSVAATLEVGDGDVLDGPVTLDGARYAGVGRVVVRVRVGLVESVDLA